MWKKGDVNLHVSRQYINADDVIVWKAQFPAFGVAPKCFVASSFINCNYC